MLWEPLKLFEEGTRKSKTNAGDERKGENEKIIAALMILFIVIIMILFFAGGLKKRTDVVLTSYSISEDGTKMKLNIIISSSVGNARVFSKEDEEGGGMFRFEKMMKV